MAKRCLKRMFNFELQSYVREETVLEIREMAVSNVCTASNVESEEERNKEYCRSISFRERSKFELNERRLRKKKWEGYQTREG